MRRPRGPGVIPIRALAAAGLFTAVAGKASASWDVTNSQDFTYDEVRATASIASPDVPDADVWNYYGPAGTKQAVDITYTWQAYVFPSGTYAAYGSMSYGAYVQDDTTWLNSWGSSQAVDPFWTQSFGAGEVFQTTVDHWFPGSGSSGHLLLGHAQAAYVDTLQANPYVTYYLNAQ